MRQRRSPGCAPPAHLPHRRHDHELSPHRTPPVDSAQVRVHPLVIPWIHIRCITSRERLVVHELAEACGLFHRTMRMHYLVTDPRPGKYDYHQEYQGWSYMTTCEGCRDCMRMMTKKVSVLVAPRSSRVYLFSHLNRRLAKVRRRLLEEQERCLQ